MSSSESGLKVQQRVFGEGRAVGEDGDVRRLGITPEEVRNVLRDAVAKIFGLECFDAIPAADLVWFADYVNTPALFKQAVDGL